MNLYNVLNMALFVNWVASDKPVRKFTLVCMRVMHLQFVSHMYINMFYLI